VLAASIIKATLIAETASTSETSVNFYQTIRRNNPKDSHIRGLFLQKALKTDRCNGEVQCFLCGTD
jgi:hypothetical protein